MPPFCFWEDIMMRILQDRRLWFSIAGFLIIGLLSGLFAIEARTYYSALNVPNFAPPGYLFGPVWVILYIMIGVGHYWILKSDMKMKKVVLTLFYSQFLINCLWSFFFFTLKNTTLALIDITILWGLIFLIITLVFKTERKVSFILIPYFLWVSFASVLNFSILLLN